MAKLIVLMLVAGALLTAGLAHRNDRTLICKEQVVNGQVYANGCRSVTP